MKCNIVKYLSFFLLCHSQISLAMDLPTINHTSQGIEIPSDPELTGLPSPGFSTPELEFSWRNLIPFTRQTMENYRHGQQRGILYVHSLEFMGIGGKFEEINLKTFFNNYISSYLAHRPLIAGSIVAFNEDTIYTLADTFASISFIFEVPAECIVVTSRSDAGTPYTYNRDKEYWASDAQGECSKNGYIKYINNRRADKTLDALVRLPHIANTGMSVADMNEIAVLNCALFDQKIYRPKVVGVLYNEKIYTGKFDYGNAAKNAQLKEAAYEWCQNNQLPFIKVPIIEPCLYEDFISKNYTSWFDNNYDSTKSWNVPHFIIKDRRFLLDDNQLKGYLLKPVASLDQYCETYENKLICNNHTKEEILLEKAFYQGKLDTIDEILSAGNNLNVSTMKFPNFWSNTSEPLTIVDLLNFWHLPNLSEIVFLLVKYGLNSNAVDRHGLTLFCNLVNDNHKKIYNYLLDEKLVDLKEEINFNAAKIVNLFSECIKNNDLELLHRLLRADVDWSNENLLMDDYGQNPLLCAVTEHNDGAIKILLESQIDWSKPALNNPRIKDKAFKKYLAFMKAKGIIKK